MKKPKCNWSGCGRNTASGRTKCKKHLLICGLLVKKCLIKKRIKQLKRGRK